MEIPLLWINLQRHERRRRRMLWALEEGGWWHERIEAVDALDPRQILCPLPNPGFRGNALPGIQRRDEADPLRGTSRPELACTASWLRALCRGHEILRGGGAEHLLVLEDDSGAALAVPDSWGFSLAELVQQLDATSRRCGVPWEIVQLLATSRRAQSQLLEEWQQSKGHCRVVPRHGIRSGGTGAVLLHRRALPSLTSLLQRFNWRCGWPVHLLFHPHGVRPVADKWLYGSVKAASVWVTTYPLFCLDASDSAIHPEHLELYQIPSRAFTLQIWREDGRRDLIEAQRCWDRLV